jgi:hypothetical protein
MGLTAYPTRVAMELLQLHERQAREHAAAEKHEARIDPIPPSAGKARKLRTAPMRYI